MGLVKFPLTALSFPGFFTWSQLHSRRKSNIEFDLWWEFVITSLKPLLPRASYSLRSQSRPSQLVCKIIFVCLFKLCLHGCYIEVITCVTIAGLLPPSFVQTKWRHDYPFPQYTGLWGSSHTRYQRFLSSIAQNRGRIVSLELCMLFSPCVFYSCWNVSLFHLALVPELCHL